MSTPSPSSSTERRPIWTGLLVVVAALLLYGPALGYPFVYDDRVLIEGNAALADLGTLPSALGHDLFHYSGARPSPYWRPLITLSYYLEYALSGGAAWLFHLSNLVGLGVLGVALQRLLARHTHAAIALTAVVVLHPLMVEPVVNIASRTDLWCGALMLLSLGARRPLTAGAFALLACGAKELAAGTALAGLALWGWRDRRVLAQALAGGVFLALRQLVMMRTALDPLDAARPTLDSASAAGSRSVSLMGRVVWPRPLGPAVEELGVWLPDLLGWGLASTLGLLVVLRGSALQRAGAALAALGLAPASGLISASPRYGDGLMVLPLLGAALILSPYLRRGGELAALAIALVYVVIATPRVAEWSSEQTLWTAVHARLPEDVGVRLRLARTVVEQDPARALALLQGLQHPDARENAEIHEVKARAELGLGVDPLASLRVANTQGQGSAWSLAAHCVAEPAAPEICGRAVMASPTDGGLWNSWGIEAARGGDLGAAIERFSRACDLDAVYCPNLQRAQESSR